MLYIINIIIIWYYYKLLSLQMSEATSTRSMMSHPGGGSSTKKYKQMNENRRLTEQPCDEDYECGVTYPCKVSNRVSHNALFWNSQAYSVNDRPWHHNTCMIVTECFWELQIILHCGNFFNHAFPYQHGFAKKGQEFKVLLKNLSTVSHQRLPCYRSVHDLELNWDKREKTQYTQSQSGSSHRGQGHTYPWSPEFSTSSCFPTLEPRTECHYYVELFACIDRTFLTMS